MKPLPDLSRAFSPVPPVVHTRMTQTLEEIHHMKKRNVSVAFALAAVLAQTLVGAALAAAQSGVMRFLLGDTAPNAAQQQMQRLNVYANNISNVRSLFIRTFFS